MEVHGCQAGGSSALRCCPPLTVLLLPALLGSGGLSKNALLIISYWNQGWLSKIGLQLP